MRRGLTAIVATAALAACSGVCTGRPAAATPGVEQGLAGADVRIDGWSHGHALGPLNHSEIGGLRDEPGIECRLRILENEAPNLPADASSTHWLLGFAVGQRVVSASGAHARAERRIESTRTPARACGRPVAARGTPTRRPVDSG